MGPTAISAVKTGVGEQKPGTREKGCEWIPVASLRICSYTIVVGGIRFEWDEAKSRANQRKHGVSFQQASLVFRDPQRVLVAERVVDGEQRWQTTGVVTKASGGVLLLLVAHTVREEVEPGVFVEVVRIISARKATSVERRNYVDENG